MTAVTSRRHDFLVLPAVQAVHAGMTLEKCRGLKRFAGVNLWSDWTTNNNANRTGCRQMIHRRKTVQGLLHRCNARYIIVQTSIATVPSTPHEPPASHSILPPPLFQFPPPVGSRWNSPKGLPSTDVGEEVYKVMLLNPRMSA